MTSILKNIRELDARLKRGELSKPQYERARETLLQSVEDAQTEDPPLSTTPKTPEPKRPDRCSSASALGFSIVVCLGVMGLSVAVLLLFLPDINLALTLGVTLLAALAVALFRAADDLPPAHTGALSSCRESSGARARGPR